MIEMSVRDPDRLQHDAHGTQACREGIALGAGIDDRGAATLLVDHEIGVGLECTDRHGLDAQCHQTAGSTDAAAMPTGATAVSSTGDSPMP